jgi:hypothetical protein
MRKHIKWIFLTGGFCVLLVFCVFAPVIADAWTDNLTADEAGNQWLIRHCAEYGFILRYPEDKVSVTEIEYEPWHFRYVGKEAAQYITENNLTLEEFWDIIS